MSVTSDVLTAEFPEDVFGSDPDTVGRRYHELSRELHPDKGGNEGAFQALSRLYDLAKKAIKDGRYGRRDAMESVVIKAQHSYQVARLAHKGNASVIYEASYEDGSALVKVARADSGKLIVQEGRTLKLLGEKGADTLSAYLPEVIESFRYRHGKIVRPALAFKQSYDLYTLDEIRTAYPDGIHPRDSAWMIRRLLYCLAMLHETGWTHNQVCSRHMLIQPEEHGLVLADWTQASKFKPSVTPVTKQADIRNGIAAIESVTELKRTPQRFRIWMAGCSLAPHRIPDAATLLSEFDRLIEAIWGPKRFHPFSMPTR